MGKSIAYDQLPFATPPYSMEFIEARASGKYRIHDAQDNAVGHADSEAEADEILAQLNR